MTSSQVGPGPEGQPGNPIHSGPSLLPSPLPQPQPQPPPEPPSRPPDADPDREVDREPDTQPEVGLLSNHSVTSGAPPPTSAFDDDDVKPEVAAEQPPDSLNQGAAEVRTEPPRTPVREPNAQHSGGNLPQETMVGQLEESSMEAIQRAIEGTPGAFVSPGANASGNGKMNANLFARHSMEGQFNLVMALANLSAARMMPNRAVAPPPTVAPADVSLPTPMHETADPFRTPNGNNHQLHGAMAAPTQGLESFARIEFADSVFQMTTYAVIIGRDQRALEQARLDERRAEEHSRRVKEHEAMGLPPPSLPSYDRGKFSKSYVSEEGGMLGPESDGGDNPRPSKRRKTSTGGSGSQSNQNQQEPVEQAAQDGNSLDLISNRQYVSHTPGAAVVDLELLKPSPDHVPFIGIHSPGPGIAAKTKAISREHLKIQFNRTKGVFEAIPLHKNGFFREDIHYREESVVLRSHDRLQIKDVDFVFIINGVKRGHTGAEELTEEGGALNRRYSEGGKEMSFEFESSHGGEIRETSEEDEEAAEEAAVEKEESELSEIEEDELENPAGEEAAEDEIMETVESDEQGTEQVPKSEPVPDLGMPPKKRGPGRPPKNGIRSKREERLLRKQALEEAKRNAPPPVPGEPPVKRKVGRPRKHPLPEGAEERPEKRKYKPRKPKNEDGGGSDGEKAVKEKRREKPKTPPLELKKEDFTAEQLQKPNKNYGVLIDEVLSEAPQDGLTLKQIYKRIQKKYPYYFFVVDTKGWESSVRHNLIGNDAFRKNEETHLWCRVPGIELDAGKKRKAASPDHTAAAVHNMGSGTTQWNPQMPHPQYPAAPQGYHLGQVPPPGYPAGSHGLPPQAGGQHGQLKQGMQQPTTSQPGQVPPQPAYQQPQQQLQRQPSHQPSVPPTQAPAPVSTTASAPIAGTASAATAATAAPAPAPAQLPGYGQSGVVRQLHLGQQTSQYNSPYAAKPPPPLKNPAPPNALSTAGGPGLGAVPQPGHPPAHQRRPPAASYHHPQAGLQALPTGHVTGAGPGPGSAAQQHQSAPSGVVNGAVPTTPPPLKPAIDPDVANFIKNFRVQVISQLEKRLPTAAELVAMSVINRGIGLTTVSLAPDQHAAFEKIIFGVFDTAKQKFPVLADPKLLECLTTFKTHWVNTLKSKLGEAKSEALLLSAIDRVLGFCEKSIMQPANEGERKEYEEAENLFMPLIRQKVVEYQRSVTPAASTAAASISAAGSGR